MLRRSSRKRKVTYSTDNAASARRAVAATTRVTTATGITPPQPSIAMQVQSQGDTTPLLSSPSTSGGTDTLGSSIGSFDTCMQTLHSQQTPNQIASASADISVHVSQNVKEKIQNGEYIDLSLLLVNNQNTADQAQKIVVQHGELVLQQKQNTNKIFSIEQWTTAFIIYASIYGRAHPETYNDLLKYMSMIRLGATRSINTLGFKMYDEQYRLRKSQDPLSSWGNIDVELWLLYMGGNSYSSQGQTPNSALQPNNTLYKCYKFNYEGNCFRKACFYKHLCIKCNGGHPAMSCPYKQVGGLNQTRFENRGNLRSRFPRMGQLPQQNLNPGNFTFRHPGFSQRQRAPFTTLGFGQQSSRR